ncbi:helix-turn-helix domain-containing protein [Serpentinicella sp. ANB-PHB4]
MSNIEKDIEIPSNEVLQKLAKLLGIEEVEIFLKVNNRHLT